MAAQDRIVSTLVAPFGGQLGEKTQMNAPSGLIVRSATPRERAKALALLFSSHPTQKRVSLFNWALRVSQTDPSAFEWLCIALRYGEVRGVLWGRPIAGRSAVLWGPVLAEGEDPDVGVALVAYLDQRASRSGVQLSHANLTPDKHNELRALASNGYRYITDIAHMGRLLEPMPHQEGDDGIVYESYSREQSDRLKRIIQRTNEGSLDCQAMRGVRHIDDVLDGHYFREGYVPSHWKIVRCRGRDVGCLLLSSHAQRAESDIIYLGLTPEARGHGLGTRLVRHAMRLAHAGGAVRLYLTCDVSNPPALTTYLRAGFHEIDRWSVYIKSYPIDHQTRSSGDGRDVPAHTGLGVT